MFENQSPVYDHSKSYVSGSRVVPDSQARRRNMVCKKTKATLKIAILVIVSIFTLGSMSWAATYYVSGSNGNDGNPGTLSSPWRTISKANSSLKAGDTVFIRAGNYNEPIRPTNSGSSNSRITYKNYNNDTVTISNIDCGIELNGKHYITIDGIKFTNIDKYANMSDTSYCYLQNLVIGPQRNHDRWEGIYSPNSSYNRIQNCTIYGYGDIIGTTDRGDMVYVGEHPSPGNTHHWLIENNHMYHGGHNVISFAGHHNILRNNYFHNEGWYNGEGNRIFELKNLGTGEGSGYRNLIEGNRFAFNEAAPDAPTNSKAIQHQNRDSIYRKNMFYHLVGPGLHLVTNNEQPGPDVDNNYVYHNNFFNTGLSPAGSEYQSGLTVTGRNNGIDYVYIKNNIFNEINGSPIKILQDVQYVTRAGNWEDTGNPGWTDAVSSRLDVSNRDYPDFTLTSNSPCIDNGTWLTTTSSSGSGIVMKVENAQYFMDGWGIPGVEGDIIQLENQSSTARIVSVDYNTNVLTLDTPLTWTAGQGLALQYGGSAPDQGAFESGLSAPGDNPISLSPPINLRVMN